jgi:hypothetical protein
MKTTIRIELTIVGPTADALQAVDDALDAGLLQDAINEKGTVQVRSAIVLSKIEVKRLRPRLLKERRRARSG